MLLVTGPFCSSYVVIGRTVTQIIFSKDYDVNKFWKINCQGLRLEVCQNLNLGIFSQEHYFLYCLKKCYWLAFRKQMRPIVTNWGIGRLLYNNGANSSILQWNNITLKNSKNDIFSHLEPFISILRELKYHIK